MTTRRRIKCEYAHWNGGKWEYCRKNAQLYFRITLPDDSVMYMQKCQEHSENMEGPKLVERLDQDTYYNERVASKVIDE